ncbi:MAG: hypothetical protein HZA51_06780 [Planctomycetes bacterium]|nr:hypothetical protein [Planctomycetota bacterium]
MVGTIALVAGIPISYSAITSALHTAPDKAYAWIGAILVAASAIGMVAQIAYSAIN